MKKINWGILSTAKIGITKVIPALQKGSFCEVSAIASRDLAVAKRVAASLRIPRAYGSYEELLADPGIDAIYIPLPNHLHVDWAIRSMEAGKHVLCEKPVGMTVADAERLTAASARFPGLKVMEAFMYHFHPQWQLARKLVKEGAIGNASAIQAFFSYFNTDPGNIRNKPDAGGGSLMDIGCYCISQSRFLFDSEPVRVTGSVHFDPVMGTDRLSAAIMEFPGAVSSFTCSTQLSPYQRFNILGTDGRIEVEIPVNASPVEPARIWLHRQSGSEELLVDPCDQYTLQGDAFSKAILEDIPVPFPLADATRNMKVIEAIFESGRTNGWVAVSG